MSNLVACCVWAGGFATEVATQLARLGRYPFSIQNPNHFRERCDSRSMLGRPGLEGGLGGWLPLDCADLWQAYAGVVLFGHL